jgi:hypothetical protein
MSGKNVFNDFLEYWHYTRPLSRRQRLVIFNSLSDDQRSNLSKSYSDGIWEDVFGRNSVNEKLDEIKEKYGHDLLDIKLKVCSGRSFYISTEKWGLMLDELKGFNPRHISFILRGIRSEECSVNQEVSLILKEDDENRGF